MICNLWFGTLFIRIPLFSPPTSSIVAIAGEDYAVVAADTRLSSGYSIHTRTQDKSFKLSDKTVLASTGCWCDTLSLTSLVRTRMQMYEHAHNKTMSSNAVAQMISILMYNRRFFPYYVSNVLAGIDDDGRGVVYSYDPIGHMEKTTYRAGGSAGPLLQPVLDSQVGFKNQPAGSKKPISKETALAIVRDTFISAAERDIYTGDSVILNVITKDGITQETFQLRKD